MSTPNGDTTGRALGMFLLFAAVFLVCVSPLVLPPSYPTTFYVAPDNGRYTVRLHVMSGHDVELVQPIPFEEATELANRLNKDMAGKWARGGDK